MNIYVGNIAHNVSDAELEEKFAQFGKVKSAKIIRDMFSGDSKGFGFVEMLDNAEAQTAIEKLNTSELKGKNIVVNEARPKRDNRRRGGGNRGRGGSGGKRY